MAVRKVNRRAKLESKGRRDRRFDNREVTGNRTLKDDVRLDEFRKQFHKDVLPDLPKIPGYHVCWLTTNNPQDSIPRRMLLGYSPVMAADIPGWSYASLKTGEYAGAIGINEMIAFKIPQDLWEEMMYIVHHERPLEDEAGIREKVEEVRRNAMGAAKRGGESVRMELEEGMEDLGKSREPPPFAKVMGELDRA